jgi:N-formylglutamate amidohydrolase
MRDSIKDQICISDAVRFREEDPYTGIWTNISGNRIIANHSRFEFDLNRPPEKAVYILPEDSWGLQVWKSLPSDDIIRESRLLFTRIYSMIKSALDELLKKHGKLVVYDLHSYNQYRMGPDKAPEDPELNPEINIGTGTMNRDYWSPVIERFIADLSAYKFWESKFDVRENVKFKGGYFPKWIHHNYGLNVCCISIEVKKIFMDEWTGQPDISMIRHIGEALLKSIPGVLDELNKLKAE